MRRRIVCIPSKLSCTLRWVKMLEDIVFEYYDSVDSTNERIKSRAREGASQGLVISAGNQTAGKGRIGRKWESPEDVSISTSILLTPQDIPIESVPTITVVAAMAVRKALADTCGLKGQIKWPNDIVFDGKKICGILTEMEMRSGKVWYVTCGIGVNVHNMDFSEDIAYKATSVDLELKKQVDTPVKRGSRRDITRAIWFAFRDYYNIFLKTSDMSGLREDYEKWLANKNNRVRIEEPAGAYEAVALGIDDSGALRIDVGGEIRLIKSGEVSVRGIYGYT